MRDICELLGEEAVTLVTAFDYSGARDYGSQIATSGSRFKKPTLFRVREFAEQEREARDAQGRLRTCSSLVHKDVIGLSWTIHASVISLR